MELKPQTQDALREFQAQNINSPILELINPLFDTLEPYDASYPTRVSDQSEHLQLLWERGERRTDNFELICLTLSKRVLSLTIALDHHHRLSDIPAIPQSAREHPSRSSLIITPDTHIMYKTHKVNAALLGNYYNEEAIDRFTPDLKHSLAFLDLNQYEWEEERQAS